LPECCALHKSASCDEGPQAGFLPAR